MTETIKYSIMSESKTYVFTPEGNGGVDATTAALMNGGWGGGMNNPFWAIILLAFLRNNFGWNGDGGNNTSFVASQLGQAIAGNGNALSNLSTSLNCSISQIQAGLNAIQSSIAQVANQTGMSGMQIINSIQSGNAAIQNQIASCCCDIKQSINGVSTGVERGFSSLAYENASNFCSTKQAIADNTSRVLAKLDAIEDSRKDREISTLTAQLTAANSRAERQAELAPIYKALNDIECKQPNVVTVPANNGVLVPSCVAWQMGLNGLGLGYGLNPYYQGGSIWS